MGGKYKAPGRTASLRLSFMRAASGRIRAASDRPRARPAAGRPARRGAYSGAARLDRRSAERLVAARATADRRSFASSCDRRSASSSPAVRERRHLPRRIARISESRSPTARRISRVIRDRIAPHAVPFHSPISLSVRSDLPRSSRSLPATILFAFSLSLCLYISALVSSTFSSVSAVSSKPASAPRSWERRGPAVSQVRKCAAWHPPAGMYTYVSYTRVYVRTRGITRVFRYKRRARCIKIASVW